MYVNYSNTAKCFKMGKHFIFPAVYEQKIVPHLLQHFVSLVLLVFFTAVCG